MCGEVGLKQKLREEVRSRDPSSTEGTGLGILQHCYCPSLRSFSNWEIAMLILHCHLFLSDMLR